MGAPPNLGPQSWTNSLFLNRVLPLFFVAAALVTERLIVKRLYSLSISLPVFWRRVAPSE